MAKTIIVLPNGTEISSGSTEGAAIQSITLTEKVNEAQELTLGSVCANCFKAKIIDPQGELSIKAGDELSVYFEQDDGTRKKIGLFTTEKPTRPSANTMSITAYDRVLWLDKDLSVWLSELTEWPYSLYSLAEKVCDACGLTLANAELPNGDFLCQAFTADGITGRTLIRWIGQIAGRFCRATADGKIEFAWYKHTETHIQPSGEKPFFQNSLKYEDYETHPIEKVQIQLVENDIGAIYPNESGELNTYIITGNYLLTTNSSENLLPIAQSLYETLKDVTYTPFKIVVPRGDYVQAGDIITITDRNGKTFSSYVMTRSQSGQRVTLEGTGNAKRKATTVVHSETYAALNGKILQVEKSVEKVEVTASEISTEIDNLGKTVSEQQTTILETSREVMMQALESYVKTKDLDEYRTTVSTQLQLLSDELLIKFATTTNQITEVDGNLQDKFTELYQYISMKGGKLTFSDSVSTKTLALNNGKIEFANGGTVFGEWDGDNFYTGNIVIRVSERAQFGVFALIPRSDKSLMVLKVGD